ncbi:GNAT family N-acetyltransferase [Cognatilysobacter bugurensis]|nr:GNAT family N-acetyltransferase [Lysobacter bugurensis]
MPESNAISEHRCTLPWSLRAATEDDRAFCWRLHEETMRAYVEATWGWDGPDQRMRFEAAFDPAVVRIVEVNGRAAGWLKVDASGVPVRLLSIAIAPCYQRSGLGTAVIGQVVREAAGWPVWLQVLKVNPARALYERLGFVLIDETPTHWELLRTRVG